LELTGPQSKTRAEVGRIDVPLINNSALTAYRPNWESNDDGEVAGAIRDLVDLDQLLRWFGRDDGFWYSFRQETPALDLVRPAYYALRYARRWFGTPLPDNVVAEMTAWAPPAAIGRLMDTLVDRAVLGTVSRAASASVFALYVRSHWLKMPPLQVVRHLTVKAFK